MLKDFNFYMEGEWNTFEKKEDTFQQFRRRKFKSQK